MHVIQPQFRHHVPAKPLSDYVALFWYWNHTPPSLKERILPSGTVEFVIRLKKNQNGVFRANNLERLETHSGAIITGPQSRFFVLDKSEQDELIGVHFKPGGSFPFFGAPASDFLNEHVSLDSVWGTAADDLRCRLIEAATVDDKFQILERSLLTHGLGRMNRHPAVGFALKALNEEVNSRSLAELASEANLSGKRLTQLFSREVGLTPKVFLRIQRYQRALKTLQKNPAPPRWCDLALDCGYHDQAHFNHDFLEFSGICPTAYMEKRTEQLGHVPL